MKKSIFASILSISVLSLSLLSASAQLVTDTLDAPNSPSCVQLTKGMTTGSRDSTTEGQVSDLQFFLSDKGYLRTDPTGYFGLATLAAVKAFQGDNGITQNGLVGPITRAKIASLTCSGDEPVSGNEPVSTTPSSSIGNLSVNLTYRGGDTLVPGGSSAQNVSPLSPRTWSWTTTGAASVSARYSIYGANCVLSAGTTITEENWQPWLGINITGTRFSGSNTRTLGSQYYGCTIEATYKARNTQNQTVASTVKVTFAPSATSVGTPVTPPGAVACTMDAKMCPDGSYVGRVGPSCAFAACPSQVSPETHPLYSCNGIISHVPCSTTSATSSQQNVCLPPTTTLTLGDGAENGKTEEVLKLQRVLIRLGFGISSGPTGYFGTQTQTAVRAAQARYGLPVTGVLDMTSLNRIMQYCGGVDVRPPVSGSSFSVFKMTPGAYVSNIYQEVKIQWDASVSGTLPVQIKCTGPYKPSGASQLTNVVTVALGGVSVDPSMSGMYTIKSVGTTPFGITGERSMLMAPEYAGTHNCIATAGAISAVASFTITPPATYPSSKVCARVLPSCTSSTLVGTPTSCQASYVTYNSPTEVPSGASVIHQGICATGKVCAQPPMPPCPAGVSCIQAFPPLKTFDSLSAMEEAGASFRTIGECSSVTTTTTSNCPAGTIVKTINNAPHCAPSVGTTCPTGTTLGYVSGVAVCNTSTTTVTTGLSLNRTGAPGLVCAQTPTEAGSGSMQNVYQRNSNGVLTLAEICRGNEGKVEGISSRGIQCQTSASSDIGARCSPAENVFINGQSVRWKGNTSGYCYADSACDNGYECTKIGSESSRTCKPMTQLSGSGNGGSGITPPNSSEGALYKRTWTGASWGAWEFVSCRSGFHEEGARNCVSNTKSCVLANAEGKQTYNTTTNTWGTCQYANTDYNGTPTCVQGFFYDGASGCISKTRSCTLRNDYPTKYPRGTAVATGVQTHVTYPSSMWEGCEVVCKPGYVKDTVSASTAGVSTFQLDTVYNLRTSNSLDYCKPANGTSATYNFSLSANTNNTLSPDSLTCIIPIGGSSCDVTATWTTSNATLVSFSKIQGTQLTVLSQSPSGSVVIPSITPITNDLNLTVRLHVEPGTSGPLRKAMTLNAVCITGSTWNGSSCVASTATGGSQSCSAPLYWNGSSCVSCPTNTVWNGSVCAITTMTNIPASGYETLTGYNCTILAGESTCRSRASVANFAYGKNYDLFNELSRVTTSNAFNTINMYYYNPLYGGTSVDLKYGQSTLRLRESGSSNNLTSTNVIASCASGLTWNGTACVTTTTTQPTPTATLSISPSSVVTYPTNVLYSLTSTNAGSCQVTGSNGVTYIPWNSNTTAQTVQGWTGPGTLTITAQCASGSLGSGTRSQPSSRSITVNCPSGTTVSGDGATCVGGTAPGPSTGTPTVSISASSQAVTYPSVITYTLSSTNAGSCEVKGSDGYTYVNWSENVTSKTVQAQTGPGTLTLTAQCATGSVGSGTKSAVGTASVVVSCTAGKSWNGSDCVTSAIAQWCNINLSSTNFFQTASMIASYYSSGLSSIEYSLDGGLNYTAFSPTAGTATNGSQTFGPMTIPPATYTASFRGKTSGGTSVMCTPSAVQFTSKP